MRSGLLLLLAVAVHAEGPETPQSKLEDDIRDVCEWMVFTGDYRARRITGEVDTAGRKIYLAAQDKRSELKRFAVALEAATEKAQEEAKQYQCAAVRGVFKKLVGVFETLDRRGETWMGPDRSKAETRRFDDLELLEPDQEAERTLVLASANRVLTVVRARKDSPEREALEAAFGTDKARISKLKTVTEWVAFEIEVSRAAEPVLALLKKIRWTRVPLEGDASAQLELFKKGAHESEVAIETVEGLAKRYKASRCRTARTVTRKVLKSIQKTSQQAADLLSNADTIDERAEVVLLLSNHPLTIWSLHAQSRAPLKAAQKILGGK